MSVNNQRLEVPVKGMDCAGCASTVRQSIASVPGVRSVEVLLSSEKAVIQLERDDVSFYNIKQAVERAGYTVPARSRTIEMPVKGMDCAGCASTVRQAIAGVPGVESVEVLLSSEKAVIQLNNS